MRVSRLMLVTLRDVPADAEIASQQLLIRGGYIRRVGAGIYAYLPLMWRVLQRVMNIVREEMNQVGALETLLPQLQPAELWEKSGRWQGYTAGEGIMFHLEDRQKRSLGLGPTHEEIITELASDLLRSYRQLPVTLYQIQSKFRDEIRPRFGLMRGREFIMKDAYSFHTDEKDLSHMYNQMDKAYVRIFQRCGLQTVGVDADSGAIGGAASQEFMVTADAGEDLILTSPDGEYAANQEKAISTPTPAVPLPAGEQKLIATPGQITIDQLCEAQSLHPSQVVKVLLLLAKLESGNEQPVLIGLRGDQELNEVKLLNALTKQLCSPILELSSINNNQLKDQGLKPLPFGSIGPDLTDDHLKGAQTWQPNFHRLADTTASTLERFVCGANTDSLHRWGSTWSEIGTLPTLDLRNARAGDPCAHNPDIILEERRGIEVGHIFQLGKKYSESMGAQITSKEGKQEHLWMGCYGIGISRLAQAAAEQHHDDVGIIWPVSIAPFQVIVVVANIQDATQMTLGEEIYSELRSFGIDALIDDRGERAGVKFKDADLIGIPWRVVVGRAAEKGDVELVQRSERNPNVMSRAEAITTLLKTIPPELRVQL